MATTPDTGLDIHLIEGCKKGDAKSQEGLYKRFYGYAMSICARYAYNEEEAVEILNDTFIKVFKKIKQYEEQQQFKAWLRRILVNTAIDYYRKNKKYYNTLGIEVVKNEISEEDAVSKLSVEDIQKLLDELPEILRLTFNLYEIEGYSHEEIAQKLNTTSGTSRSYLARAKKRLRALFEKHFGKSYEVSVR